MANPANSIRVYEGNLYLSINVESNKVFIYRVPNVIFFILGLQYFIMFADQQKYLTNSLRKGRIQGFQADILQAYTLFANHMQEPHQITIKQFDLISQKSNLKFLVDCKAEQQQEEEYIQVLYQVLLENYFIKKSEQKQIFCVFSLYLFYCRQDKKKKIKVDSQICKQLKKLLEANKNRKKCDFMKVIKRLVEQCFSYNIKYGVNNIVHRQNPQIHKKNSSSWSSVNKKESFYQKIESNQDNIFRQIKKQIPQLQQQLISYQLEKKKFNMYQKESEQLLQCWGKDVTIRMQKHIKKYQKAAKIEQQK